MLNPTRRIVHSEPLAAGKVLHVSIEDERAQEAEAKAPRFVQRPLYATEEMIEAVREWAFKNKRPAQEFYREGLLMRLHEAGLCRHIKREDLSE